MRRTSAPCSASVRAAVGPASTRVRSSTRTPLRGRSPAGNACGGALSRRVIVISGAFAKDATLLRRLPLGIRTNDAGTGARVEYGVFQRNGVPAFAGDGQRFRRVLRLEQRRDAFAVVNELAVQVEPAPVARLVDVMVADHARYHRRTAGRRLERHVAVAVHRRGARVHVDLDALLTSAALLPQTCRRHTTRGDRGGAGLADRPRQREHGVCAVERDVVGAWSLTDARIWESIFGITRASLRLEAHGCTGAVRLRPLVGPFGRGVLQHRHRRALEVDDVARGVARVACR